MKGPDISYRSTTCFPLFGGGASLNFFKHFEEMVCNFLIG